MQELAERFLGAALSAWGLDVEYASAAGDLMFRTDDPDRTLPVRDYVGGFGSLFFGHNHPELVAHAVRLLRDGTPGHAQLSKRAEAQRVAAALSAIAERELGTGEPYEAIFANSGAEAVEAAVKHAELSRAMRTGTLGAELAAHADAAESGLRDGTLTLFPETAEQHGPDVLGRVREHNAAALATGPVFLALTGGFHGKLTGSLQLTHNPGFRLPFAGLGAAGRFVDVDRAAEVVEEIAAEQPYALDPVVRDGVVSIERRPVPYVAGFVVEPIQGEGGINVLTADQAAAITAVCRELDCPLIVDEIQTGAGRTGAFFASSHIGLAGDYYTLAKSVGGGLAKTAVLMVRQSRYVKEFELLHSSTYAKDSFSCAVTEKVLEMLERDGGAAYRRATDRGARLREALEAVRADYPDVVTSVRGRGLLAGFEFADQSGAVSPVIRNYALSGFFGFAVSGFLLRKHRLRLMPTGSAPRTLRVQPSSLIDDESIDALAAGLRDVCEVLRHQDAAHFVDALCGLEIRDFRSTAPETVSGDAPGRRVAYVAALGDPAELRRFDVSLAELDDATLESFLARQAPVRRMAPLPPVRWGSDADVTVFPILAASKTPAAQLATDVALQSAAAAGFDAVVVSSRLTGAPARTTGELAGFVLPAGIGDGDGVPAELAEHLK